MKRFVQLEQRRFEQQVAPNIDQAAPAPVRGPVRIAPPDTRLPDLSMIQTALQDGARLAVQLAGYAKKAQDEADELAQIEFDGWVKSETIRRSAEFAKLPIAEQEAQSAEFRDSFVNDAKEYAANLNFSSRRRQVVDRLIPAHADQFGARLYAESIRQMERNNCDKLANYFKAAIDNADVDRTGEYFDKMIEKGMAPGMTRDQAISRAVFNQANSRLGQLTSGNLSANIEEYDLLLEGEKPYYDLGDGAKISRRDLLKLRDNAKRARSAAYKAAHERFAERLALGELDVAALDEALKTGEIDAAQHRAFKGELAQNTRKRQQSNYEAEALFLRDAADRRMLAETDDERAEVDKEIADRKQRWEELAKNGELRDLQLKALKSGAPNADKLEDRRIADVRKSRIAELNTHISQMDFAPYADKYDGSYLAVRDEILNSPHLTGEEKNDILKILKSKVKGSYSTSTGKQLDQWLKDNFISRKTVKGQTQRKYVNLKWDPWGPRKEDSQQFQEQRYLELRAHGERLIAEGKMSLVEIEDTLFDMAKKLRANDLPGEAKQFVIDGLSPVRYIAKPAPAAAEGIRKRLSDLPRDRKSAVKLPRGGGDGVPEPIFEIERRQLKDGTVAVMYSDGRIERVK